MEKTHDEEMAIDLWELISALKKRALIILAACLLGGVVAGVYTKLCITPMYTATSSMLVTTQETTLTSIPDSFSLEALLREITVFLRQAGAFLKR